MRYPHKLTPQQLIKKYKQKMQKEIPFSDSLQHYNAQLEVKYDKIITIALKEIKPNDWDKFILVKNKNRGGKWEMENYQKIHHRWRIEWLGITFSFIIFLITGPLLSLILNKKIIKLMGEPKQGQFIKFDIFCPHNDISVVDCGFILRRIIYFILGMTMWIYSPFVFFIEFFSRIIPEYDWDKLKKSIETDGYDPEKFDTYIVVRKLHPQWEDERYELMDGNHRVKILMETYGEDYKIKVKTK